MPKQKPIIICGPTASGKSDYALNLAQEINGVILNGDSMQIYRELPILTAQPSKEDQSLVPHKLYGVLDGDDSCSVARWREMILNEINWCYEQGLQPIVVGGTGLYLNALMNGLTDIPDIDPKVRQAARDLHEQIGPEAFYQKLLSIDPDTAAQLNSNDRQRVIRAYEVKQSTGQSLSYWHQKSKGETGLDCDVKFIIRPREDLHKRASQRFDQMLENGALNEVKDLLAKSYGSDASIMKALGVPELTKYIKEEYTLDQAREKSIISTRQYIKRQSTWFRHQMGGIS